MTEVVHKGGQFIVQDDTQKGQEATYLALFARHPLGTQWIKDNGITTKISCECPDFIFKVPEHPTIGLEVVNFVYKTPKNTATMRLEGIAKKIVGHFKKKDIPLSLLLEIYDPRKWSVKWADHLDACYNPGFDNLNATDKEIKTAIINALESEGIKPWGITKKYIDLKGQTFVATASRMHEPHTSVHVNNMGRCEEDPLDELQETITRKNKKFESYKANCDECDLLVVIENGFVHFTDKLQKHKFESAFRNTYLLDLSFGCKVLKLNTVKPREQ